LLKNKDSKKNITLEVLTKEDFNELIKSDEDNFDIDVDNLNLLDVSDFENDQDLQKLTVEKILDKYNKEIKDLEDELNEFKKEKNNIQNSNDLDSNKQIEKLNIKINQLELIIDSKKKNRNELKDDYSLDILVQHNNFNELLEQIDKIDPD